MAKRNGNGNKRAKKQMVGRDRPLPSTLPADLKPYDINNDGVLDDKEKRIMVESKKMVRLLKKAPKLKVDKKGKVAVKVKGKKAVNASDLKKRN